MSSLLKTKQLFRTNQGKHLTSWNTMQCMSVVCVRSSSPVQTGSGATQQQLERVPRALSAGYVTLILFIPCMADYRFTTPNEQNVQTCSLHISITVSHLIFPHVSVFKRASSGNQTKTIQYKNKLTTFAHSRRGVKESSAKNVNFAL
jgi:hypothetical protein